MAERVLALTVRSTVSDKAGPAESANPARIIRARRITTPGSATSLRMEHIFLTTSMVPSLGQSLRSGPVMLAVLDNEDFALPDVDAGGVAGRDPAGDGQEGPGHAPMGNDH